MWNINFISEDDFKLNIKNTIEAYLSAMNDVDLREFNKNIIDPIKLLFDMKVYGKTTDELIEDEINRQIDKTNTNSIGYFNQNIFKYIDNCIVPQHGFDVIYTNPDTGQKIYVEMKNKHNTMNEGGKNSVFENMIAQITQEPQCTCFLVEVISGKSKNEIWNYKQNTDERIRRVSIDQFYKIVTGEQNAFKKICDILPYEIDKVLEEIINDGNRQSLVLEQLRDINPDIIKSMFLLAFNDYEGFEE